MLALPLQRIVAVDSKPIFRTFINKNFGAGADERFEADFRGFQSARDAAISVTQSSDENGLNSLLFIIFQLKKMAPRLAEYESEMMMSFSYYDAFKVSRKISSRTLYYDLSAFLWNYAALHSHIGSRTDRLTDEGIKNAQKHFQQSAGALEYINDECLRHMKDTTGLSFGPIGAEVLNMCKELMLAQAQLCFYEKAVKDRKAGTMKPGIIAKLAAQTATYYQSASNLSTQGQCASYIDESWGIHAEFQNKCFSAAAEYWMSQSVKESAQSKGSGYAIEIARLNRAEIIQQQAINFATKHKLGISLTNGAASLLRTITSTKTSAINDNRTVYMESVPPDNSLSPVDAVSLVKPSQPPEYKGAGEGKSFFNEIQPKALKALIANTKDQLDTLQLQTCSHATVATNDGRRSMAAVGLPGSLETYNSGGQFPENLWLEAQRVQSLGGVVELESRFKSLQEAAERCEVSLVHIDASICMEERNDAAFRGRFPDWGARGTLVGSTKGVPSNVLNADIKINIIRLREALGNARKSDGEISRELSDHLFVSCMDKFKKDKEGLKKLLPTPSTPLVDFMNESQTCASSVDTSYLKEKLYEMATLLDEREKLLEELKSITSMDISSYLISMDGSAHQNVEPSDIIAGYLSEAQRTAAKIVASVADQEEILRNILVANENFVKARKNDPITLQTDKMIQSLEQGASRFFTVHSQLIAGSTFYSSLQMRLTSLLQSSDDLAYTQQLLRHEFEEAESSHFQRQNQESQDREFALKLAEEMKPKSSTVPPVPMRPVAANTPSPVHAPEPVGLYQYPNPPLSMPPSYHDESPRPGTAAALGQGTGGSARVTLPALNSNQAAPRDLYRNSANTPQVTPDQSHSVQAIPYHAPHDFSSLSLQPPPKQDNMKFDGHPGSGSSDSQRHQDMQFQYQKQQQDQERQHQLQLQQQQQQHEQYQNHLQQQYQQRQLEAERQQQEQQRQLQQHQHYTQQQQQQPAPSYEYNGIFRPSTAPSQVSSTLQGQGQGQGSGQSAYQTSSLPPIQSRPQKHVNPKVNRLVEMGFPQDRVITLLAANQDDENAALNSLLSEA